MKRLLLIVAFGFLAIRADAADTLGKVNVRTNTKTDVQAQQAGADGATLEQVSANNSAQAAGGSWVLPAIVQSALPTYSTNGNLVGLTVDSSGRLYVTIDSTVTLQSNIKQINGAAPSATNPFASQLTDGTTSYVSAKTGQFPSSLGQTTKASSLSVALASDQGTLAVSSGAPSGAAAAVSATSNIASAGTTAIVCKGSLAVSQPLKLYKVVVSAKAAARCTIQYNDNAVITKWGSVQTSAEAPNAVFDCTSGFCALTTSSTATTQQIEANCNNFDGAAQDFVCSVQYCQSAAGC